MELFFGFALLSIDLGEIVDTMTNDDPFHSVVKDTKNKLNASSEYLMALLKQVKPDENLRDEKGVWDITKVKRFLDKKKRFLRLLILGIHRDLDSMLTMPAIHITGGQPGRGPELGSIKYPMIGAL